MFTHSSEIPHLQEYPGLPHDKLPEHVKPSRVHFDNLGERFKASTHAGVKGKHLRAVTILGIVLDVSADKAVVHLYAAADHLSSKVPS